MKKTPQFKVGDSVAVKAGVQCPDKETLSLAGWQGRVTELYPEEGTLEFHWDSLTLRAIPDDYIRESVIEGLDWASMVLDLDEVEPATPRDTPQDVETVYNELEARHAWDSLADMNPGISAVLGGLTEMNACLAAWEQYLARTLRFPFQAIVEEALFPGPVREGTLVDVRGIASVHDLHGIYVQVKVGARQFTLPLCELEATDQDSPNYQPVNDYVVWYANR